MSFASCRPSCKPIHLLHAAALPAQAHSSQRTELRSLRSAGDGAVCTAKASLTHSYIPAPDLQLKRIAGDGRCLFRATACAAHHLETGAPEAQRKPIVLPAKSAGRGLWLCRSLCKPSAGVAGCRRPASKCLPGVAGRRLCLPACGCHRSLATVPSHPAEAQG